jgi:hypothetical protein
MRWQTFYCRLLFSGTATSISGAPEGVRGRRGIAVRYFVILRRIMIDYGWPVA